jgi:hypothetical protein
VVEIWSARLKGEKKRQEWWVAYEVLTAVNGWVKAVDLRVVRSAGQPVKVDHEPTVPNTSAPSP